MSIYSSIWSSSSSNTDTSPVLPSPPASPTTRKWTSGAPRHNSNAHRKRQEPPKPDTLGIHPSEMIGKVLKRVSRSPKHPTVTLHFTDNTTFQIRVDGYNPMYPGVPKQIETDPALAPIFSRLEDDSDPALFTISHAVMTTLRDRAFELGERESHWDQHHSAVAFKFAEEGKWHCVWVTLEEYDRPGRCVFRSFDDVYLDRVEPVSSNKKWRTGKGQKGKRMRADHGRL